MPEAKFTSAYTGQQVESAIKKALPLDTFEHVSDEVINEKDFHILWKVTPNNSNIVSGVTIHPETGCICEVVSTNGELTLRTLSISAGDGLTDGEDFSNARIISHATTTPVSAAPVKVGYDKFGHVVIGAALGTTSAGAHEHDVTSTIPASSFLTSASGNSTKISLNKTTETFVKSYPGVTSNLVTATITGTNGTVTASKATAGTTKDVAKAGEAVTVATKATNATTVGNANVGIATDVVTGVKSATATTTAMEATYDSDTNCLIFSVGTVTPTVTLNTTSITPATASTTTIYGCGTNTSVIPAVANGTITPYTFAEVTAAKAADTATTVATGVISTTGTGDAVLTGLGTAITDTAIKTATVQSGTTGDVTVVTEVKSDKNSAAISINGTAASAGAHAHEVE